MDLRHCPAKDSLWMRLNALRGGGGLNPASLRPRAITSAVRMLLDLYPRRFRMDRNLRHRFLRAFVLTIVPGADDGSRDLIRMYDDTDYPFFPYTGYLVCDLARRSARLFRSDAFDTLDPEKRTSVLLNAFESDETTSRLYTGAALMAQVSYYAGIYNPGRGCPLIDFPGKNRGFTPAEISYSDPARFLGVETVIDGNPL